MVGEEYMKRIVSEVLPVIGKEIAELQAELLQVDEDTAMQIYYELINNSEKVIGKFMESKKKELSEIRKALEL